MASLYFFFVCIDAGDGPNDFCWRRDDRDGHIRYLCSDASEGLNSLLFVVCSDASKGYNYLFVFAETPMMVTIFLSCCCAVTPFIASILI